MTRRKTHVWHSYKGDGRWRAYCGMEFPDEMRQVPTDNDLKGATCLFCIEGVASMHGRTASRSAGIAEEAWSMLKSLRLKRARRRKKR